LKVDRSLAWARGRHRLDCGPRRIIFETTEALGDREMAQPKEADDRSVHIPEHLIETINKLVRTSRQMLTESAASRPLRSSRQSLRCHAKKCASS
jgi:hypothetical protein